MKEYIIKFSELLDDDGEVTYQELWSENYDDSFHFSVCNLDDHPEDAIIKRDLFSASDFIKAVELGMNIANRGYDKIIVDKVI